MDFRDRRAVASSSISVVVQEQALSLAIELELGPGLAAYPGADLEIGLDAAKLPTGVRGSELRDALGRGIQAGVALSDLPIPVDEAFGIAVTALSATPDWPALHADEDLTRRALRTAESLALGATLSALLALPRPPA